MSESLSWLNPWFHSIYWNQPLWLLLAFQPLILYLIQFVSRKRKLACYADTNLQDWVSWQRINKPRQRLLILFSRQALYVIAWLLFAISLAGPRLLIEVPARAEITDMNIMMVVDVSQSMQTRDIEPNRLRRVQIEIAELLQRVMNKRIGIILYAARAHLFVPFTDDINALKFYLQLIDSIPLPTSGSSPTGALELALDEIKREHFNEKSAILWFTDGDFINTEYPGNNAVDVNKLGVITKRLTDASVPLYILGMGSAEGEAIPMPDGSWLQHQNRPVISRMNEEILNEFSDKTNGRFIIAQDNDSDWNSLYDQGMARNTQLKFNIADNEAAVWHELYPWTLFPAILIFFLCAMPFRLKLSNLPSALFLVCILIPALLPSNTASADDEAFQETNDIERQAYRKLLSGDFADAAQMYGKLPGYEGRFGEGFCHYRLNQYTQAIAKFSQATLLAMTDQQRGSAIYNLANATFMTGAYAAAAILYRDALMYQPSHEPSRNNLAISLSLQQMLEDQVQQGIANRMGSGPRTAQAQQGLDINDSGSISFDNEEQRKNMKLPLPNIPKEELEILLARGLAHVKLVKEQQVKLPNNNMTGSGPKPLDVTNARKRMRELEDRQQLLWKRLFEMEEGFAVPLEQAETVPGVFPW